MKFLKKQIIINGLLFTSILGVFCWSYFKEKDFKWVDIKYLYENFEFKKELEVKLEKSGNHRKVLLDSLELQIRFAYSQLNIKDKAAIQNYELLKENYLMSKQKFEEDDISQKRDYEKQITTQLNQYIKDYAIEHHIDLLMGADGNGVLMYATEDMNRTNEVLTFINNKYEGKKE